MKLKTLAIALCLILLGACSDEIKQPEAEREPTPQQEDLGSEVKPLSTSRLLVRKVQVGENISVVISGLARGTLSGETHYINIFVEGVNLIIESPRDARTIPLIGKGQLEIYDMRFIYFADVVYLQLDILHKRGDQ